MPSSGIVDCTVVGSEEVERSPCLHGELQQGCQVLEALEVEKSELQTQLTRVSMAKGRENVSSTNVIAAANTQLLFHGFNQVCFDC